MADRKEKVRELTDRLEEGVREVFESGKYAEYLKVMSRFHHYSPRNSILIAMQRPDATLVAGFQSWKKNFGRYVKRGEKAIEILAPMQFKIPRENEEDITQNSDKKELVYTTFRPAYVFDLSQTDGKELPSIVNNLSGEVPEFNKFMDVLKEVSPVPIEFEKLSGPDGFYSLKDKKIVIDNSMSEPQTMAAVIHEIAHSMLHDNDKLSASNDENPIKDSRTKEVEAESIAYVVCQYFGIETGENSFGYVASWSKDKELKELFSSLETIKDTANQIIDSTEKHFEIASEYAIKDDLSKVCEPSFYLPSARDYQR